MLDRRWCLWLRRFALIAMLGSSACARSELASPMIPTDAAFDAQSDIDATEAPHDAALDATSFDTGSDSALVCETGVRDEDSGDCVGICTPGEAVCLEQVNGYLACGSDGTPREPVICSDDNGGPDFEVCRNAECVLSPDIAFGNDEATAWDSTAQLPSGHWLMVPVAVTQPVRFIGVGASFRSPSGSARMRAALWRDVPGGVAFQRPDEMVWYGPSGSSVLDVASLALAHPDVVVLAPGRYWAGINTSEDVTIPWAADASALSAIAVLSHPSDPAVSGLNHVIPDEITLESGNAYGIWVVGRALR